MRREVRYGPRFVQLMSPSPARAMLKENKTWAGAPRKGDEVMDHVSRWVRDRNPDAPPRRTGSRAGAQVATRHRDEVEGLLGDLASARRDRDAAVEGRDRARAELDNERRGRRRRREGSTGEDDERGRSRRRYDSRDDERSRRSGREGGRYERW